MMDEREDRQDAWLAEAAKEYHAPPPTPKAEMWERIQAARRASGVVPIKRRSPWTIPLAVAATLIVGVAIGRFTSPGAPEPTRTAQAPQRPRSDVAARLATADHLSQAESFLTEFGSEPGETELPNRARTLLATTRLLLDSKRVTDQATRQLLEDLELVLVQIATLDPDDRHEELGFIADGLSQNHLRTRLRNAIPTPGPVRL